MRRQTTCVRLASIAAIVIGAAEPFQAEPPQAPPARDWSEPAWAELAQRLPELVQLAALDTNLAASLVPDDWIDLLIDATLETAAEPARVPEAPDAPHRGALGPWPSARHFAHSVEATDPVLLARLFEAERPRIARRCRARGVAPNTFDTALRDAVAQLSAPAIVERAAGEKPAVTRLQRELARLGVPTALIVGRQGERFAQTLWGGRSVSGSRATQSE